MGKNFARTVRQILRRTVAWQETFVAAGAWARFDVYTGRDRRIRSGFSCLFRYQPTRKQFHSEFGGTSPQEEQDNGTRYSEVVQ